MFVLFKALSFVSVDCKIVHVFQTIHVYTSDEQHIDNGFTVNNT